MEFTVKLTAAETAKNLAENAKWLINRINAAASPKEAAWERCLRQNTAESVRLMADALCEGILANDRGEVVEACVSIVNGDEGFAGVGVVCTEVRVQDGVELSRDMICRINLEFTEDEETRQIFVSFNAPKQKLDFEGRVNVPKSK